MSKEERERDKILESYRRLDLYRSEGGKLIHQDLHKILDEQIARMGDDSRSHPIEFYAGGAVAIRDLIVRIFGESSYGEYVHHLAGLTAASEAERAIKKQEERLREIAPRRVYGDDRSAPL